VVGGAAAIATGIAEAVTFSNQNSNTDQISTNTNNAATNTNNVNSLCTGVQTIGAIGVPAVPGDQNDSSFVPTVNALNAIIAAAQGSACTVTNG